ncbi:TauD/TfdA family dioxygenase [Crocosphaera sp. UHCC 0190]|uniref:TauD/TfdA family dioxygenase n=1 Tax=Crocosphaera sp. UHCC 0190 TaxID=3110246 RepID=UPI002B20010C|nr:TauD/TfdA family dioxygenase [Crocosphaera sp. UHCC 0190]MEA5510835.1 TauD/TfdA family dioxygenase [Crocosphaera sp. UHCC 0190]
MLKLNDQTLAVWEAAANSTAIPTVITPSTPDITFEHFVEWINNHRESLNQVLMELGALLLRGFKCNSAEDFESVCKTFSPELLNYIGGGSPRTIVKNRVYTSTHYPAQQHIMLHNECSYLKKMPSILFFFCQQPPTDRGETPIGDMRRVLEKISPDIRDKFAEKGVTYISNLHGGKGFNRSWQETFQTDDRSKVEQILTADGYDYQWKADGGLQTSLTCPGIRNHPITGKAYWGNQAINWHPHEFDAKQRQLLLSLYGENGLPKNARYGDGTPISDQEIDHIREVLLSEEVVFNWQQGDILICDNQAIAHGRQPFTGERKILVSMA